MRFMHTNNITTSCYMTTTFVNQFNKWSRPDKLCFGSFSWSAHWLFLSVTRVLTLLYMAIMFSLMAISIIIINMSYIIMKLSMDLILILMIVNLQVLILFWMILHMYYYQYLIQLCQIKKAMTNNILMDIEAFLLVFKLNWAVADAHLLICYGVKFLIEQHYAAQKKFLVQYHI